MYMTGTTWMEGDKLRRWIRIKINVVYYEEVVIMFAFAVGKRAIAWDCNMLASQGFLAAEEVEGKALGGHEAAQKQGEEGRRYLHGGGLMREVGGMA
jgi:hypothetical protein